MKKHANIPIFIPHEGCKNECVFCNQRTITGTCKGSDRDIVPEIEEALSTIGDGVETEIAFFGGSFTGIGTDRMTRLLDSAYKFVKDGRVKSIRLSTRPDYINEDILDILKARGVTHIELGIQSMKQSVLDVCKRGHTVEDTERACRLICDYGFVLGGQMMLGLPSSTDSDEYNTMKRMLELGCKEVRIYPCVVFRNTELCNMMERKEYIPLSLDYAVYRAKHIYQLLKSPEWSHVKILRMGLQSSELLSDENEIAGGAYHPAFGEMVISKYFCDLVAYCFYYLSNEVEDGDDAELAIYCAKGILSKVIGHKRMNMERYREMTRHIKGIKNITIIPTDKLKDEEIRVAINYR